MKSVDTDCYPSTLCVCNDGLWVGGRKQGLFIYNIDLQQTKHIEHCQLQEVTGVIKTPTGVIVCDCNTGVHHLNHQGNYTNLVSSGHFSDACLDSPNRVDALEYKQGEIHAFVRNQNRWVKDIWFKLVNYDGCPGDKLCTTGTHLYVSSCNNHCVLVYTLKGEYIYSTGGHGAKIGQFKGPLLSDVDSEDNLLVCDCYNHRLQVFDTQIREWAEVSGLEGVKYPVCAGVGNKHIWVGKSGKLFKFEAM